MGKPMQGNGKINLPISMKASAKWFIAEFIIKSDGCYGHWRRFNAMSHGILLTAAELTLTVALYGHTKCTREMPGTND